MRVLIPLREALADPKILGGALVGDSWAGWKSLLLACAGEKLTDDERVHFAKLTGGREREPGDGVLCEAFVGIGGRRGGKSRAMATFCVWMASCVSWEDCLSLGERGRVMFVAPSMDQARVTMDYAKALFDDSELLHSLVENELADELHLKRRIIFEIQAASAAHSRGKTAVAICCDESAFLKSGDAVNSDEDLVTALRPSLATTGGPLLLTSSPAGAEGLVYQLFKKHYGPQGDVRAIVAKGSTVDLNPSIRVSVIDRAYAEDPEGARAEYGAEFREPSSAYLTRDIIERCVDTGLTVRSRLPGVQYRAYVDVSTGAGRDAFAMCISHCTRDKDRDLTVIDHIFEKWPPFDPLSVVAEVCAHLKAWNIGEVMGDQFGKSLITAFARLGIRYIVTPVSTSDVYLHALPAWTSGTVSMLDGNERAVGQIAGLRRKIGQGGRETVEHPKNAYAHDDLAAVICGAIYLNTPIEREVVTDYGGIGVVSAPRDYIGDVSEATETMKAWLATQRYGRSERDGGLIKLGSGRRVGSVLW